MNIIKYSFGDALFKVLIYIYIYKITVLKITLIQSSTVILSNTLSFSPSTA